MPGGAGPKQDREQGEKAGKRKFASRIVNKQRPQRGEAKAAKSRSASRSRSKSK